MVTKGQLLERPVVIPVGDICLDGIYLRGEAPSLVVVPPAGGRGGCMSNPVGTELAYAAAYAKRASIRFDHRGVGASEGEISFEAEDLARDLNEAVDFIVESTRGETPSVAVASYLSGAWAALSAAVTNPAIDYLLLVAPVWKDAPEWVPRYEDVKRPILVVFPGDEPSLDLGEETERVDAARNARLKVIPGATLSFREKLKELARLVPPILNADLPD